MYWIVAVCVVLRLAGEPGKPRIAVIIPNRNKGPYLRQCLDSVLAQTPNPVEIVVVDDNSKDDSRPLLEAYSAKQLITLICLDRNMGVSYCRHRAIESTRCEYITTLDSDDFYFTSTKREREWQCIVAAPNEKTIAFSDVAVVDAAGTLQFLRSARRPIREGDLSAWMRHFGFGTGFIPRDFLFERRHYFEAGGFDQALSLSEDWDLKVRLADLCSFQLAHHIGSAYRQTGTGLASVPLRKHLETTWAIFAKNAPRRPRRTVLRQKLAFLRHQRTHFECSFAQLFCLLARDRGDTPEFHE